MNNRKAQRTEAKRDHRTKQGTAVAEEVNLERCQEVLTTYYHDLEVLDVGAQQIREHGFFPLNPNRDERITLPRQYRAALSRSRALPVFPWRAVRSGDNGNVETGSATIPSTGSITFLFTRRVCQVSFFLPISRETGEKFIG